MVGELPILGGKAEPRSHPDGNETGVLRSVNTQLHRGRRRETVGNIEYVAQLCHLVHVKGKTENKSDALSTSQFMQVNQLSKASLASLARSHIRV
jgi:hypothetical protein